MLEIYEPERRHNVCNSIKKSHFMYNISYLNFHDKTKRNLGRKNNINIFCCKNSNETSFWRLSAKSMQGEERERL